VLSSTTQVKAVKVFDASSIASYSRKSAYDSKTLRIKAVTNYEIRNSRDVVSFMSPFESRFLPPLSNLLLWQEELSAATRLSSDIFFIKTDFGNISLDCVKHFITLHKVRSTKINVIQEIDWFNESYLKPKSVQLMPSSCSLNSFKSIITNQDARKLLTEYQMTPNELAMLCGKRYLSGDHMHWVACQLTKQSPEVVCVYINSIIDINRYVERIVTKKSGMTIKKICFIVNVGRTSNGDTYIGCDERQGFHWAVAFYESETRTLSYGNSLGWEFPNGLEENITHFVTSLTNLNIQCRIMLHDAEAHRRRGKCGDNCTKYPYQTCSNVCGVVAVVMSSIFSLHPTLFKYLGQRSTENIPFNFLERPTKYNKYLRRVLMCWFASSFIDVRYVSPLEVQDLHSDSDDDADVVRMPVETTPSGVNVGTETKQKTDDIEKRNKTGERIKCAFCEQTFTTKQNLKKHQLRKHKDKSIDDLGTGKTLCLECGKKFHRVVDLKVHLTEKHLMVFRNENLTFESHTGN